jgi:hypothetical protein
VGAAKPRSGPSPYQRRTATTPGGTRSKPPKKPRISASKWMQIRATVYSVAKFCPSDRLPEPQEMIR